MLLFQLVGSRLRQSVVTGIEIEDLTVNRPLHSAPHNNIICPPQHVRACCGRLFEHRILTFQRLLSRIASQTFGKVNFAACGAEWFSGPSNIGIYIHCY